MTRCFYLDTSIWIDLMEKRGNNSASAFRLIAKSIRKEYSFGYSELNIRELKHLGYTQNQIQNLFSIMKPPHLIKLHIFNAQIKEACRIAKKRNLPKRDVLQAILCRDNGYQLISRDHHFENLKDITSAKLPEDFM